MTLFCGCCYSWPLCYVPFKNWDQLGGCSYRTGTLGETEVKTVLQEQQIGNCLFNSVSAFSMFRCLYCGEVS